MCDVDVVNIELQIVQRRHSVGNHRWPVALIELLTNEKKMETSISKRSMPANPVVNDLIWLKFNHVQAFIEVLIILKKMDQTNRKIMETLFSYEKS